MIDRLSASYVGALGNTWIHTPAFDRLAGQSLVFDRAMIDSPVLDAVYESFWTGTAAWYADSAAAVAEAVGERSLPSWCRKHGVPTLLVTDDGDVAAHRLAGVFDEVVHLSQPESREQIRDGTRSVPTTASDWQETQLAAFFAAAVEVLETRRPPALVWLHTGALGRVWDSPQTLRDQYAAEDDPPAPSLAQPPSLVLDEQTDPDMLLGLRHAYAGEISVLDHCLAMLLDTIDGGDWRNALLGVTSCRGYPLGEHGIVGDAREALYGELVRVPLFIRVPGGPKYGAHNQALVQPADLHATLLDWLSAGGSAEETEVAGSHGGRSLLQVDREPSKPRALAIARSKTGEIALATPAWFVRMPARGQDHGPADESQSASGQIVERRIELFAQPDDYFQVNEVSDRCRDIVEEFREVVQAVERASVQGGQVEFTLSAAALGVR
ncbi:MAG: sulfatase-like hydrolase/transferase [Pirellulales bacterium]